MSDTTRQHDGTSGHHKDAPEGRSTAEWVTLGISTSILLAIIGVLTLLSFRGDSRPPLIVVEPQLEQVRADDSGYYLPIVIRNEGDRTVQDAIVQGELDTGSGQPETAEITIDFLDGGEVAAGTFVFREDPASGDLTTGVTSYQEP